MSNSDPIHCSLELTVDKALNDCPKRLKRLDGRDKKALQEEWLEFNSIQDWDDLEVLYMDFFQVWSEDT